MIDIALDKPAPTFIAVAEVWVPREGRLVLSSGDYGDRTAFAAASGSESFARGEGLPGKAWAEARPVVLKDFAGSYLRRAASALADGLTSALAIPVFNGTVLKAVLVVFCAGDADHMGAIEVWAEHEGALRLNDGYYGAAKDFEWVSQHAHFAKGTGLPGGVWASNTPMLMRDLGKGYSFIRAKSAGEAGLTTGLGLPVPVPGGATYVVTLLSAKGTPIARRFEIWDARPTRVGPGGQAILIDGICAREGRLWNDETEQRVAVWQGPIGRVLGSGEPLVLGRSAVLPAGYDQMVALPIHQGGVLSHIVAWYC